MSIARIIRNSKLEEKLPWIIAFGFVVFVFLGCFLLKDAYREQFKINDLKVAQDGLDLKVSWKAGSDNYIVGISKEGDTVKKGPVKGNSYTYTLNDVEKEYKVKVRAEGPLGVIGGESETVMTEKAEQEILSQDKYEGFKGDTLALNIGAETPVTYESDSTNIAVSDKGIISLGSEGPAKVKVKAKEGKLYKPAEKDIPVDVYPKSLKTPSVKVKKTGDTKVTISWESVPYAQSYFVKVYDRWSDKYKKVSEISAEKPLKAKVLRDDSTYVVEAHAKLIGKDIKSKRSEEIDVMSATHEAEAYNSVQILGTLDQSSTELVANVEGPAGTHCPQSFSYTGKSYMIAFTDSSGNTSALVEYSEKGKHIRSKNVQMGHGNGSAYNPSTNKVYTLRQHGRHKSRTCNTFNYKDLSESSSFSLPYNASGLSYDITNNKYYLSGGNKIKVTDSDFNVERTITKIVTRRYNQDTGAGKGVALACSWNGGYDSYVDIYRASDGGYLGTYKVPLGEIESATVVDKHLVVLINSGYNGHDIIVKSKEQLPIL